MRRSNLAANVAATIVVLAAASAHANPDADKTAIIGRLQRWAAAFNARDTAGTCDLFAPSLVSTVQGNLDAGRDAVCARLGAVLARPDLQLHYSPDIREVIVSGDVAIVRLFWTLTTRKQGAGPQTSKEAGMDIFERQPNGTWGITRFIAFTVEPDARP